MSGCTIAVTGTLPGTGLAPTESVTNGWADPVACAKAGKPERHARESRAEIKERFTESLRPGA
jgi:hypothetical protein